MADVCANCWQTHVVFGMCPTAACLPYWGREASPPAAASCAELLALQLTDLACQAVKSPLENTCQELSYCRLGIRGSNPLQESSRGVAWNVQESRPRVRVRSPGVLGAFIALIFCSV